ncbi:MAG: polymerase [Rhodoferax sp.]|nr:polymerase [Rhodoferax sp.]
MSSATRQPLFQNGGTPAKILLALALLAMTLPWLNPFSPGPTPAVMPFLFSWLCIVGAAGLLVWAHRRGQGRAMVRVVALAWVAAASISAGIGLLQYFGATGWAGRWLNHTELGQAFGNLRQRNQFATLLAIGLAALLWWAAQIQPTTDAPDAPDALDALDATVQPLAGKSARALKLMLLLAAALLAAGNAASSSRTGLLQLALLAWLTWLWQRQPARANPSRMSLSLVHQVLISALVSYVVATLALPLLAGLDPFGSGAWVRLRDGDAACSSRLTLWGNVLHLIAQKPWLGWGWGELDYAHFITLYPGTRFCDILDNAHNLPLHLAVELGVPLALLACGATAGLVWRAKPWRETAAQRQLAWSLLAVVGLHSLLEYPLWYGPFQMAVLLALWLLLSPPQPSHLRQSYKLFSPLALYLYGIAAIFLVAFIAYTAWNYQLASQIYLPPNERLTAYREDTLEKISQVALFQDQVRFAQLTTTELDANNAHQVHALALDVLHFSPEAQVLELLLDSARMLGKSDEVIYFSLRYQAAFAQAYTLWATKAPMPCAICN